MFQKVRYFLALCVAMIFGASVLNAQVTTSAINGKITDENGAVQSAPVVALYVPNGTVYYSITDKNGNYYINNVTPGGPYTITVDVLGYRKVEYTGVSANLGETLTLDVELQEESLNLEAAVFVADGKNSNMNISRSGAGTSITNTTMNNIPTVSRSLNDVMKMTPQATSSTSGLSIGGGSYRGSTVTVDGAAFNNAFGIGSNLPAGGSPISIDALEQISVNITPYDVRQSGFQGGAINAVTKSGTNEWHASVYNYYTSEKFKGDHIGEDNVVNNHALDNTTGFTVGGPIIKNKLFFFVNAEYSLDDVPGSSYVASTDGSWAKNGGDGSVNRPTVAKLNEIESYLGDKFGYNPGRYQGYSLSTPDYKVLARLDWNINNNNKLSARFSATHVYGSNQPSSSMSPIGGTNSKFADGSIMFNRYSAGTQSQYAMYFESSRYYQEQNFYSAAIQLDSRLFDGRGTNLFRASWSHQYEPRSYVGDTFPTVYILDNDPAGSTFASTDNTAVYTAFGVDPFTYGNLRDVTTYTVTDEMTYTLGFNNFIGGLSFETNSAKNGFMQGGAGWYIYDSWDSFKADVENPSSSTGPVAFMITHANLDDPTSQTFPTLNYSQASAYVQDEMSISDYFKLTAGIRFEMPFYSYGANNENKDFTAIAEANPNSSFAGLSTAALPKNRVNVSPRLGFNWDVLKNRALVVRGGTGIYTGRIPNVWLVSAAGNANVLQYQYINKNVLASNASGSTNIHFHQDRADVINQLYGTTAFKQQDLSAPTGATIMDENLKLPSSWKSSLAIDARLPWGIKATLEGVYSQNFNEVYASTLGIAKTGTVQLPGEPETRSYWTSEGIMNNAGSTMGGYYLHNTDLKGNYYSVTAQLSKDFDFGLSLMAAYTRSGAKSITDGNGDQVYEMCNTYTYGAANEAALGNAYYVSPNRVIANVSYTIPEGKHTATKLGMFYEGYNIGFISSYSYSRVSYLMNNQSGTSNSQLIYIPTDSELESMPFVSAENKAEYKEWLATDSYTKKHRGEYSVRNGAVAPWLNRFNVKLAQDVYFYTGSNHKKHTVEFALDINNIGNLLNSNWGTYKQLSSATVLNYSTNKETGETCYTFTAPEWKTYNSLYSTWQMLFSAKYFF